MKTTKKELNEMQEVAKVVSDAISEIVKEQSKKTTEVTRNEFGEVINKETGIPHFLTYEGMLKPIPREIVVGLSFGTSAPTIKIQLKEQGFSLPKNDLKSAESVRVDLLALRDCKILNDKQLMKCFKKLSKQISQRVINSVIKEDETAIHIKTKTAN